MNTNKIVWVHHTDTPHGNVKWGGDLIVMYDDHTWEILFEYQWDDPFDRHKVNGTHLKNRTREEAIEYLEKLYFSGKLKGVFKA